MQQLFMAGNQFQNHMWAKFNREQREAEKQRQFELKQQKRKEKHRGR